MLRCFILFPLLFTDSVQIFVGDDPVADYNFKILGGKEAIPHSRPWIGQLFYNGRFRCGCSLISSKYALTAAHCVNDDLDERNYHVVLGGHRLKSGISVGIREITEHPQYEDVKPRYDAALLLFNENVSETDRISTIRLSERSPFANETCIVNGWGSVKYHGSPASNVLMEAKVNIFSPHNCKNSSAFDKNTMICVNESKLAGSCSGDSGGPMLCSNDNEYSEQHGIVNFGLTTSCEKGPSVYTDVSKILTWIRSKVSFTQSSEFTTTSQPTSNNKTNALIVQTLKNFNQKTFDNLLTKLDGTNWTNEHQQTLLHIAAKHGYYNAAKALINKDPQLVKSTDKYQATPLHTAAQNGRCNFIPLLLDNGADVNSLAKFIYDNPTTSPHVSALYFAAENGHTKCVKTLLDKGAKINYQNKDGLTALHMAAWNGHYKVVKFLVERGADLNIKDNDGKTALHIASRNGYYEIVSLLLEKGADVNIVDKYHWYPLHYAAQNGQCNIVSLLLSNGADPNALGKFIYDNPTTPPSVPALYFAAENGHAECVRLLLDKGAKINYQNKDGFTALHAASQGGKYEVVKLLVERGADVNIAGKYEQNSLHVAAENGHCNIVSLLLDNGSDSNALSNYKDDSPETPPSVSALYWATRNGSVECASVLLNKGAKINQQTRLGRTALYLASVNGNFELVKTLLENGADTSIKNNENQETSLHMAAFNGHCDIVSLLLDNGANVSALSKYGNDSPETPPSVSSLQWATINGHAECVRILLNKGADINHQDRLGRTALHIAATGNNYGIVKFLIENGADTNIKTNDGKTAFELARDKEIIDHL